MERLENAAYKWRKQYKKLGELKDTRKGKSGRILKRELSDAEKLQHRPINVNTWELLG